MKLLLKFSKLFILLFLTVVFGITDVYGAELAPVFERQIVVFQDNVGSSSQHALIARAGGVSFKTLRHGNSSVAFLDAQALEELLENINVVSIEADVVVKAFSHQSKKLIQKNPKVSAMQILPWGVDQVDAEWVWEAPGSIGLGISVGIIDTGISETHPDLTENIKGGVSEVSYTESWDDDNGHGSHVAGVIGASDNTIGVVGVSHGVDLYAIKVLDRRGSGYLSDLIDGIDWARAHDIKIINMSLGCDCNSLLLHEAILRAYDAGVIIVAAGGNNGNGVAYPAAYPEVIAVTAVDSDNSVPYWASRGPEIDFAAPGVAIYSTYKKSTYKSLSGTSMAAPHVAGAVALVLTKEIDTLFSTEGDCVSVYDINCDGVWNPAEVKFRLLNTSIDLGILEEDDVYGAGLINAFLAFFL